MSKVKLSKQAWELLKELGAGVHEEDFMGDSDFEPGCHRTISNRDKNYRGIKELESLGYV